MADTEVRQTNVPQNDSSMGWVLALVGVVLVLLAAFFFFSGGVQREASSETEIEIEAPAAEVPSIEVPDVDVPDVNVPEEIDINVQENTGDGQ
jgi:hypothetical protein